MKKAAIFLWLFLPSFLQSQVPQQDSLALVAIYNNTGGTNWNWKTLWLSGRPVGEWYGVTVQGNRVTRLDLSDNNLSGPMPEELGNLDSLSFLDLCHATIPGLPNSIGNLKTLDTLSLFAAVIDTLPPAIGNLADLKYLQFSYTQIRYLPETIGGLGQLEYLGGFHGKLRNLPESIGSLASIKIIDLQVNEISSLPTGIGNCTNLEELWLNANRIPEIPPEIGNLTNLEYLILGGNNLIELPDEIFTLTKLKYLNFAANDLKYIPKEIGNLINLTNLQFFKNDFHEIPEEIGNLVNLNTIIGYSNRFEALPLALLNLDQMETMTFAYNALTFEDIEPLVSIDGFIYDRQDSIGSYIDTVIYLDSPFKIECLTGGEFNRYQWIKDGDTIAGADDYFLDLPTVTYADSGEYRCIVTNTLATGLTLFSRPIRVRVVDPELEYQGFPTSDGYWKVQFGNITCLDIHFVNDICSEYQYILDGDTLINSLVYHKYTYSGRDRNPYDETWTYWNSGYHGCYRNDLANKQVYFIPKDSLDEILLYDFNLSLNDTLPDTYVYHPEEYNIITIDQVDSILVNDQYLKRYHLDKAGFGGEYLIEGIGSTLGLLSYISPWFEQHYDLLCFKNDEEGLAWYENDSTVCELITGIPESSQTDDISIFPNPAADFVRVTLPCPLTGKNARIGIYSIEGKLVMERPVVDEEMLIDISGLSSGMYLILVDIEKALKGSKLLIIEH